VFETLYFTISLIAEGLYHQARNICKRRRKMSQKRKTDEIGTLKNMPTYHYSCHKKFQKRSSLSLIMLQKVDIIQSGKRMLIRRKMGLKQNTDKERIF
jgi:hypothetical protein